MKNENYKIKVFGERNTGTNYLEKLLKINFKNTLITGTYAQARPFTYKFLKLLRLNVLLEKLADRYFKNNPQTLGWKHRKLPALFDKNIYENIIFILVVRNPYDFLLSFKRRPYNTGFSSSEKNIIFNEIKSRKRETSSSEKFVNAIDLYNKKYKSYLDFKAQNMIIIRYEDLVMETEKTLNKINGQFTLLTKNGFPNILNENSKGDKGRDLNFYKNQLINKNYHKLFDNLELKKINSFLDFNILNKFSYKIIK